MSCDGGAFATVSLFLMLLSIGILTAIGSNTAEGFNKQTCQECVGDWLSALSPRHTLRLRDEDFDSNDEGSEPNDEAADDDDDYTEEGFQQCVATCKLHVKMQRANLY